MKKGRTQKKVMAMIMLVTMLVQQVCSNVVIAGEDSAWTASEYSVSWRAP